MRIKFIAILLSPLACITGFGQVSDTLMQSEKGFAEFISSTKDSLGVALPKVDTIVYPTFVEKVNDRTAIDSIQRKFSSELESLKSTVRDPETLQQKTDSLSRKYSEGMDEEISRLKAKGIYLNTEEHEFLKQSGMPVLGKNRNLPDASIPRFNDPEMSSNVDFDEINLALPEISQPQLPEISGKQFGDIKGVFSKTGEVVGKVDEYSNELEEIKQEEILKSENVDKLAEESVKNLSEVKSAQEELSGAEKLKQLQQLELQKIQGAQQLRDAAATELATKKILSHEEVVQGQIEKLNKHKRKFDNIPDMRNIPRIKPNSMKGRPLKERLSPGILFQILKDDNRMHWFVAPELLYRISGTFSAGGAGMYRFQYSLTPKIIWDDPVYGYKLITQAKIYKGFYLRSEFESTNTLGPKPLKQSNDPQFREWRSNWLGGVGKVQRISSRLNGYFWCFYNIERQSHPIFSNRVILKTGLQFNLFDNGKKIRKHIADKIEKKSKEEQQDTP